MQRKQLRAQTDRLKFNGHDLSAFVSCKVNRPIMPPVDATFESVSGRDGEVFKSAHFGGYDLPVDVWLRSDDRRDAAEVRHALAQMLYATEPAPLYLPDDPTRYLLAIVSGDTDLGEITDNSPSTTITFHVGDPFYYGRHRRMDVSAGTFAINAGGNRPTHLKITAKPASSAAWYVQNVDTGEQVRISSGVTSSSTVRVDMAQEHATVNNNLAAVTLDSDFFTVERRTRLHLSSGTAVLEWWERWL
ncbi:distal tail protein Dit [Olsenella sp. Marseille-P4559]|uniref:distal tail protein Dit n=1 Tax=Olsenella sp. Marseille-P4559 TaxID=2364795 RepID=UPI00102F8189|nr:distal tail protein Dit [Olsenella sp. Marseille-P4559]